MPVAVLAALGWVVACGTGAGGAAASGAAQPAPTTAVPSLAPVLTYYLDQTLDAVGDEPSPRTDYLAAVKGCRSTGLAMTELGAADVVKLGTERQRIWQRPGMRVKQIDTWKPVVADVRTPILNPCHFTGIKETSVRTIQVPLHKLYVMDLATGAASLQVSSTPYPLSGPPIADSAVKALVKRHAKLGDLVKIGDSHALGQPCALWREYLPDVGHSESFTECTWSGGLQWGIGPLEIVLWRKPATTGIGSRRAITTTAFTVGHLPAGSDEVFKVPAKTGAASAPNGAGVQP